MTFVRLLLGALGAVAAGVGAAALVEEGWANFEAALWWLVGGVVLHDGVLVPLTIGAGVVAAALLPGWLRPAAVAAGVVLGTVTVMAMPVLGRFGARPDNPTLLDRDYTTGWVIFASCVLAGAVAWGVLVRRRRQRSVR